MMKKKIAELKEGNIYKLNKKATVLYLVLDPEASYLFVRALKLLKGGNIPEGVLKTKEVYHIGQIGPDGKLIKI